MGVRIDYVADRVTVAIPRRCLGSPRWVKVGMGEVSGEGTGSSVTMVYGPIVRRG